MKEIYVNKKLCPDNPRPAIPYRLTRAYRLDARWQIQISVWNGGSQGSIPLHIWMLIVLLKHPHNKMPMFAWFVISE